MLIKPDDVHKTLTKYMLIDGLDLVLDLKKSKGCRIYNSRSEQYMLDCFSFFASAPLGCNHPKLTTPEFIKKPIPSWDRLNRLCVIQTSEVYQSIVKSEIVTQTKITSHERSIHKPRRSW